MNDQIFNVAIATKYGLLEAIIIRHLQICLMQKKASRQTKYCGKYWERIDKCTCSVFFPYASQIEIDMALEHLCEAQVMELSNIEDVHTYAFVNEDEWI